MEAQQSINDFNELLKGEISATETYNKALEHVKNPHLTPVLEEVRNSHEKRAERLRQVITEFGGAPEGEAGVWGTLSKLMTEGASALGDGAVLAALEEGEDVRSNDYEWRLVQMHGDHRNILKDELYPEQQATHKKLSELTRANTKGIWPPTPDMKEV